ncbi:replication initiator protein A [Methylorubrum extorquens]|uniref:replication initiator protein A n=1 Tax=Methylorubrum extorquens TaxID=408 RepID=UPI003F63B935
MSDGTFAVSGSDELDCDLFGIEDEPEDGVRPRMSAEDQALLDRECAAGHGALDLSIFGCEDDPEDAARPLMSDADRALLDRECPAEPTIIAPLVPSPHRAPWPLYDVRALMERPFFSLASRGRPTPIDYVDPKGRCWLRAVPAAGEGVASIRDAELLVLIASRLMHELPRGTAVPAVVDLNPRQLLQARGLSASGREYALLRAAFARLRGTRYTTNIGPDGKPGPERTFTLITEVGDGAGRGHLAVGLGEWFHTAVAQRHLLSLTEDYFGIAGHYERWLYRVARKHVGYQPSHYETVPTLWGKSGQGSPLPRFRYELRRVVRANMLPDYQVFWLDRGKDEALISMSPRPEMLDQRRRPGGDTAREERERALTRHSRKDAGTPGLIP